MLIGCPRERKSDEFRVALTPAGVRALVAAGHQVRVEKGAGRGASLGDAQYADAGAEIVASLGAVYESALVIKVKEPVAEEYPHLREETLLFCFLHLAAAPELARILLAKKVTAVAFETVTAPDGSLPLLTPMSLVAGRLAVQVAASALQRNHQGKGVLLAGLPGVPPAHVLVVGAGVVGQSAVHIAVGMGARVTVADINPAVLTRLDSEYQGRIATLVADHGSLAAILPSVDALIGAVLVPGARAPKVITRDMIHQMEAGSVAVDVAVDQGGCFETTHATTHHDPIYLEAGVLHYAVANMPSLTARTSTLGLANATLPILLRLAANPSEALGDPLIYQGLTTRGGEIVHRVVRDALKGSLEI